MFEQPISGTVHLVDSILPKSVWKYLPVKLNSRSTDWFLYAINFHWKVFPNRPEFLMILCYTTKDSYHR